MLKQCSSCLETKTFESFHREARRVDGRNPHCKLCISAYKKARYVPRPPRALRPDRLCAPCNTWKLRAEFYSGSNRCKDCDRERGLSRKRTSRNPAVNAAKNNKRRDGSLDLPAFAHPLTSEEAAELFADMPACMKCGATDSLHLDHVMPIALGGKNIFWNFQVLCAPCNLSKGATYADYRNGLYL